MTQHTDPTTSPLNKNAIRAKKQKLTWILYGVLASLLMIVVAPLAWWDLTSAGFDGYNYYSYRQYVPTTDFILAGTPFPTNIEVYTTEGQSVPVSSLWMERPLVLETGSISSPMYQEHNALMASVASQYRGKANVAVLYTREAHPGIQAPPHRSHDTKLNHANKLKEESQRPVFVDRLDGALHKRMGGGANSVYIIGMDGIVAHYAYWNDPDRTAAFLDDLIRAGGNGIDILGSQSPCTDPVKTVHGITRGDMRHQTLRIAKTGGIDAFVDYLAHLASTSDNGVSFDPYCETES